MTLKFERLLKVSMLCVIALSVFACSKYKGFKKDDTGYYYKFYTQVDTAQMIQLGDLPEVIMEIRVGDSLIFGMNDFFPVDSIRYEGDLNTAFLRMHKGDSAVFILDRELFSTHYMRENLDFPEEEVYISVKVNEIVTKKEMEEYNEKLMMAASLEPVMIEQFLAENNWNTEMTPEGIYMKTIKSGKGEVAEMSDMVSINFTGKLLDGKMFASTEGRSPVVFQLGMSQVLPGWHYALLKMKKGEVAEVIIPSRLAYGEMETPEMPPFSPLHFTLELVDITKAPEGGFTYK